MNRYNLGCGTDIKEGYVNIDLRPGPGVQVMDLSKKWSIPDGSASEVLMLDFLEHFPYSQTAFVLSEAWRILEKNGVLVIQVPDGDQLVRAFHLYGNRMRSPYCNNCGERWTFKNGIDADTDEPESTCGCGQTRSGLKEAAMRRMYGGQDYPGNFHHTLFDRDRLKSIALKAGFDFDQWLEVRHQELNWNIKASFRRAALWR